MALDSRRLWLCDSAEPAEAVLKPDTFSVLSFQPPGLESMILQKVVPILNLLFAKTV
jgi:hypothetical protein